MPRSAAVTFSVNGRTYHTPARPIVVVCLDGGADPYLDAAMARGLMPSLQRLALGGFRGEARAVLPSFTNVNNASILTGAPPSVHGITGNFFLDPETGAEVMMNAASFMRSGTILAAAARAGRSVALVTAKEKLRHLLSAELSGIAFSAERAADARIATHGIADVERLVGMPAPPIYSADASLFVLRAGVALIAEGRADFLYLSTTDYVQHCYEPTSAEALAFCAAVDHEIGRLVETHALVGLTADHGMNAKQTLDGAPNVVYLETMLADRYGPGVRVILPITDPYVAHHGALGSLAMVHLRNARESPSVAAFLMEMDEITEVYDRRTAARKLELPEDRIGDLVVLSRRDVVIGRTPDYHDLSALAGALRSHGGRYEEMVPFFISEPLNGGHRARAAADPRNFDIFDFTLNGTRTA
jgi:phosphonoacetate hydrolase